ncbi:MAG: serine hydroxymethyltransferase [Patescibacteria group bacterium]
MKKYQEFIDQEINRQNNTIGLIASENFVSPDVARAMGSVFTNKYAEGYVAKRYYAGNQVVDDVEEWAQELALQIFGLSGDDWRANVQPYSGSPANMAIYLALLEVGDKIMSLKLSHGGHLTHGHRVSFSGKLFNFVHYEVNKQGWLDYDQIEELARQEKPKMIVAGATAYPRQIDFARFRQIADSVGAYLMTDISHIAGLIVAGVHPSCFPYADVVMTTTHKTLRGPRGAIILSRKKYAKKIDSAVFPGLQGGPHENIILAKAVAFAEARQPEFITYQQAVVSNAQVLSKALMEAGYNLVSGGTDNHLLLLDLSQKKAGAKQYELVLEENGIVVNKNTIPYDQRSPFDPSGLRLGTPAVTTRGMRSNEMKKIAQYITLAIDNYGNDNFDWQELQKAVKKLANDFLPPVYQ